MSARNSLSDSDKKFERRASRRDLTFRRQTGQELIKLPGIVGGNDFKCSFLKDCTVHIFN